MVDDTGGLRQLARRGTLPRVVTLGGWVADVLSPLITMSGSSVSPSLRASATAAASRLSASSRLRHNGCADCGRCPGVP